MRIPRLSPITVGSLLLSILVFAAAAMTVSRSRHRDDAPSKPPMATQGEPQDSPIPPARSRNSPSAVPLGSPPSRLPSRLPSEPASPPLLGTSAGVASVDGGPHAADDKTAVKNRQLLVAAHNLQLIVQADEHAFDALKLAESTRFAIRKIDEQYGRSAGTDPGLRDQLTVDRQIGLGIARNDQAERERRAAIKDLLGPEGATDFATAEYAEARRLRIRYRRQWAEELDTAAPWPEGVPRSSH